MDKFDNNIIAVVVYVFSNIVVTAYIYFMKKFNVEKFKALQVLQENILDIVSQPSTARMTACARNVASCFSLRFCVRQKSQTKHPIFGFPTHHPPPAECDATFLSKP